jgi:hypothetical protein
MSDWDGRVRHEVVRSTVKGEYIDLGALIGPLPTERQRL